MKKITAFILGLCCSASALAAQPADELITSFSTCSGGFFKTLAEQKAAFDALGIPGIVSNDGIARIQVGNRSGEEKDQITLFPKTLTVAGLNASGYFDQVIDLEQLGKYYTWGFLFKETPEQVAHALTPLVFENARLKKDGPIFVRLDIHLNGKWIKVTNPAAFSGSAPGTGRSELAFLIEPNDSQLIPGGTRVSCSLQGAPSADLLNTLRPDLGTH